MAKVTGLMLKREELKALLFQHEITKPFNLQVGKLERIINNKLAEIVHFYDNDGNSLYIDIENIYLKKIARLSSKVDTKLLAKFVPCLRITIK